MSMFDRKPQEDSQSHKIPTPTRRFTDRQSLETVLAPNAQFDGRISGKTNVEIKGTLEGSCEIEGLALVSETGTVIGDVTATDVVLEGRIKGNLVASHKMELRAKSKIEGDIRSPVVAMAEGCFINGSIDISGQDQDESGSTTFSEKRQGGPPAEDEG